MNTSKLLSALVLSSILLSACASGPERRPQRGGDRGGSQSGFEGFAAKPIALLFAGMDANQDLVVSGDELLAGIEREWSRLLTKRAVGALEYGEWSLDALGSAEALPSFISFDRDLDGRMSELEFGDRLRAEFRDLDKNQDGFLDRSELLFRVTRPSRNEQGVQQGRGSQEGRRPPPR